MKHLLTLTAIIEAATGLALIAAPSVVVRLLLGGEIAGAGIPLGRVAGLGLLSLGMACWPPRDPAGNTAPALRAMLTYNSVAALYLLYLGIEGEWVGPLLWPAVALHGILSLLLARQWRRGSTAQEENLRSAGGKRSREAGASGPWKEGEVANLRSGTRH